MERLNVGLTNEQRKGVIDTLNTLLADEHVLYIKLRNYHWNVVGPRFHDLHLFLETQYEQVGEIIDEVAENARMFGGFAAGSMQDFLRLTRLKENTGQVPDENGIIQDLTNDHEAIIRTLRTDIERAQDEFKAADAADFLTSVLEKHNKAAWMLRSFLPAVEKEVKGHHKFDDTLVGSRR